MTSLTAPIIIFREIDRGARKMLRTKCLNVEIKYPRKHAAMPGFANLYSSKLRVTAADGINIVET